MSSDKLVRLEKYAESLRQRIKDEVPAKHKGAAKEFKQMLEIDLEKTLANIGKLKGQ